MKYTKKIALLLVMVCVMSLLTACGGLTEEDAQNYVQAVLDASYKGEFDAYIEVTGSTREEAEEMYNKSLEMTLANAGFNEAISNDKLKDDYKNLFIDLAKLSNYEITNVSKNDDDNFMVEVTVKPFDFMSDLEEEMIDIFTEKITNASKIPTKDEMIIMSFEVMYDLLKEKADDPQYGDSTTVVLRLEADDAEYKINDDDLATLDSSLFTTAK